MALTLYWTPLIPVVRVLGIGLSLFNIPFSALSLKSIVPHAWTSAMLLTVPVTYLSWRLARCPVLLSSPLATAVRAFRRRLQDVACSLGRLLAVAFTLIPVAAHTVGAYLACGSSCCLYSPDRQPKLMMLKRRVTTLLGPALALRRKAAPAPAWSCRMRRLIARVARRRRAGVTEHQQPACGHRAAPLRCEN
jgi:hypothetical protein